MAEEEKKADDEVSADMQQMQEQLEQMMPDVLTLQSHALHPWGLNEIALGHIGLGEETGLPFAKLHAKETLDFHRPHQTSHREKNHHGGEVTHYVREYWMDDEGKLNY